MWDLSCASDNTEQHLWPPRTRFQWHTPPHTKLTIRVSPNMDKFPQGQQTLQNPRSRGPEGASAGRKGTKSQIWAQVFSHVISLLLTVLCDKNHYSDFKGNESEAQRRKMTLQTTQWASPRARLSVGVSESSMGIFLPHHLGVKSDQIQILLRECQGVVGQAPLSTLWVPLQNL